MKRGVIHIFKPEIYCNGCVYLKYEHTRKNDHTAHCLDPDKPVRGTRRTIYHSEMDIEADGRNILRPGWCRGKREEKPMEKGNTDFRRIEEEQGRGGPK